MTMLKEKNKILLVEDDKDLIGIMSRKLSDEGFEVITADDGQQALKKIEKKPDLVLLDILLPDMDGLTVLNEIAADPETKNIPVIILSNLADQSSVEQAAAIGDYDYLVKARTDLNDVVKKIKEKLDIN